MNEITFYAPGKNFPSLSTTGNACALNCKHCNKHYLEGMIDVSSPEKLLDFSMKHNANGGTGFLLSGGADINGKVNISRFLPAIKKIKNDTNLIINYHSGVIHTQQEANMIANSGVDMVSVDFVASNNAIRDVYSTENTVETYTNMIEYFLNTGIPVVPHITLGLHGGKVYWEYNAIDILSKFDIPEVVFIILIPTKGTEYETVSPVNPEDVEKVFSHARKKLKCKLVLGCMRPRLQEYEISALENDFDGIVLPSRKTISMVGEKEMKIEKKNACCSVGSVEN